MVYNKLYNYFLRHISIVNYYITKISIILLLILFLINSTSPLVYIFNIQKIGSFSNIADNWINYLVISFIIFNSFILIVINKRLNIPHFILFIILYLFLVLIATLFSENYNINVIWESLSFFAGILFFICLYQIPLNNKNYNLILWGLFFSGFVNSLISLGQIYSIEILNISFATKNYPSGGFFQTNKLASFLATTLLCPLFIQQLKDQESKSNTSSIKIFISKHKFTLLAIIVFLISALNLYILKLTNSLTGFLGLSISLTFLSRLCGNLI